MNWAEACAALVDGKKIRQERWLWEEYHWAFVADSDGLMRLTDSEGGIVSVMQHHMTALDWEIVEVPA